MLIHFCHVSIFIINKNVTETTASKPKRGRRLTRWNKKKKKKMNEKIPFCILFSLVVCSQHANNNHDHKLNSKYIWTRTARAKSQSTERTYMCVCLCVSRCLCDVVVSLYTKWICKESAIKLIFYHNHHSFVRISIIIIISHLHTVYDSWCVRDTANDGNRGQFLFLFLFYFFPFRFP